MTTPALILLLNLILAAFFGGLIYRKIRKLQRKVIEQISSTQKSSEETQQLTTQLRLLKKDRLTRLKDSTVHLNDQIHRLDDAAIRMSEIPDASSDVKKIRDYRPQVTPSIAKINGSWEVRGDLVPIHHEIKRENLIRLAEIYGFSTFVETGTNEGDMIAALVDRFDELVSIELSDELFERASNRFSEAANVTLIHGDSARELQKVVNNLQAPALFWLDGHYSGGITASNGSDTPILQELEHIATSKIGGHAIIIDDAREFTGFTDYPKIDDLQSYTTSQFPNHQLSVVDDAIWILPTSTAP